MSKPTKCGQSLFSLLYENNYEAFVNKVGAKKPHLDENDGKYTYLQYSCQFGLERFVRVLLELNADPNKTCSNNPRTPLMIAASGGYINIVQALVQTQNIKYDPIDGENAFHSVLSGLMTCHQKPNNSTEDAASGQRDFYQCIEYLHDTVPSSQLNLNSPDKDGNTVLHYAFQVDRRDIIHLLLEKGAYIGHKNRKKEMAIKFINAETLETLLNDSINTNGLVFGEDDYQIIFKYDLLAPPKLYLPKNRKSGYLSESGITDKDQYEIISETEPLIAISEVTELRPLLKHPYFTTFLNLKWYTIRMYFWINLVFYLTFWSLLTTYVLYIYGPTTAIVASTNDTIRLDENNQITELERSRHGSILWCSTLLFSCILLFREFFQFSISPFRYIKNFENWIEIALIITVHSMLLCEVDLTQNRAKLSAIAIFLSWMELVLLIGRHPRVSTYIEMFKVVTLNFLKFLAWYSVLILAFALSFYLLFKDTTTNNFKFFKTAGLSIFKSAVMITGEYDSSNIPFSDDISTGHLLFVLFIFLVSIVLFNLLNGLAVSDTQAIRKDAELVGIIYRAKLIMYIEKMAISDPFPYLGALDKLACCCCCIPIRRNSAARKKHFRVFYNRINLFPSIFPDREVRVLMNQENRVVMQNTKLEKKPDGLRNCYGVYEWRINKSIIKAAREILSERVLGKEKVERCDVTQAITNLQEAYKKRLETLEEASKKADERLQTVEDVSKRTEQRLDEIVRLLKKRL